MADFIPAWQILVDWDNNANFSDTYDDISGRVDIAAGITATRGRDPARSLGEPRIPAMQFVGFNEDKFFSNDFSGSPIYQKITTGRPTRLQYLAGTTVDANNAAIDANDANTLANGTLAQVMFTGYLDRVVHQPQYNERRVTSRVLGSLVRLKDRLKLSTQLYANITTGEAMGFLLDAAGVAVDMRVINQANTRLKYWWLDREDPYRAAVDLLHTEGPGAYLGEDEFGRVVFEGKDYRPNTERSVTNQASFLPDGTGVYFAEPEHEDGAEDIINIATYRVTNRELQPTQAIWQNNGIMSLAANEVRTFELFSANPFQSIVSPLVSGTDWTTPVGSLVSATAVQVDAVRFRLTITVGSSATQIAGLQVRAAPYMGANQEVTNIVDTSTSQNTHGPHARDVSGRAEIDPNVAAALCDTTVQRYMTPRAVNHFVVIGYDDQAISQIFARQVSDRIHYIEPQTGQDIDALIESKNVRIIDSLITCTFGVERSADTGYGRYDLGVYDVAVYGQ